MSRFSYGIDDVVFDAHPQYRRGVVVANGVINGPSPAPLLSLLREAEAGAREQVGTGDLAAYPEVTAWRDAYRRFGARPSDFRSSIEALLRRVAKGDRLPSINAVVDIGNLVSLRHLLPAGAHPLDDVTDDLWLRGARAGDRFAPTAGSAPETPPAGEIVFATGSTVLTRRWTWRQAAGTQILPHTRALLFNIDGLPPTSLDQVQAAMAQVAELLARFCGASAPRTAILDRGAARMEWLEG